MKVFIYLYVRIYVRLYVCERMYLSARIRAYVLFTDGRNHPYIYTFSVQSVHRQRQSLCISTFKCLLGSLPHKRLEARQHTFRCYQDIWSIAIEVVPICQYLCITVFCSVCQLGGVNRYVFIFCSAHVPHFARNIGVWLNIRRWILVVLVTNVSWHSP